MFTPWSASPMAESNCVRWSLSRSIRAAMARIQAWARSMSTGRLLARSGGPGMAPGPTIGFNCATPQGALVRLRAPAQGRGVHGRVPQGEHLRIGLADRQRHTLHLVLAELEARFSDGRTGARAERDGEAAGRLVDAAAELGDRGQVAALLGQRPGDLLDEHRGARASSPRGPGRI